MGLVLNHGGGGGGGYKTGGGGGYKSRFTPTPFFVGVKRVKRVLAMVKGGKAQHVSR